MKKKHPNAPEDPDIVFAANVRARELRFDEAPDPEVRFRGHPERRSVSESERENLPEEVRPGVTYRDVGVRVWIANELAGDEFDL